MYVCMYAQKIEGVIGEIIRRWAADNDTNFQRATLDFSKVFGPHQLRRGY